VTVNTLPDDIFLEIFAFYLSSYYNSFNRRGYYWLPPEHTIAWQRLVHVCQRWRDIIYGSPRYLDLHLHCSFETPFRKSYGRWPEFPLTLDYDILNDYGPNADDVVAALEHPDRVHRAILRVCSDSGVVGDMLEVMQAPFPALTHLDFTGPEPRDEVYDDFLLPDDFLGGSAPRLQHLRFDEISFPTLPKLLLSARSLVFLELGRTNPPTRLGYISPEAMVGGLAGLTKLRTLRITTEFPENPPCSDEQLERRSPDLPIHALLPALNNLKFRGSSWYLEGLVAQIDAPHVKVIQIEYISPEIEAGQLSQFIGRTTTFKFAQFRRAHLSPYFPGKEVCLELDRPQGECHQLLFLLTVSPSDIESDHLVSCMTSVLRQLVALLSDVGQLAVKDREQEEESYLGNTQWLPLLHLFPAVEALQVTGWLAGYIADELQDVAEERVTEVLPALHSLWLGGGDELAGSRFLSLRQLSGRPVTVRDMQDEFDF
jgi:hypothetical protein